MLYLFSLQKSVVTSQVLQPKSVNKRYRGRHTFINLYKGSIYQLKGSNGPSCICFCHQRAVSKRKISQIVSNTILIFKLQCMCKHCLPFMQCHLVANKNACWSNEFSSLQDQIIIYAVHASPMNFQVSTTRIVIYISSTLYNISLWSVIQL